MQDIRLIALDMDGTVLDDEKNISPRTLAALRAALARGVDVVPATGRTVSGVPEAFMQLPGLRYALAANGATVVELGTGRHLVELPFEMQLALDVYDTIKEYDCLMSIFVDGIAYTTVRGGDADDFAPPSLRAYLRRSRQMVEDMPAVLRAHPDRIEKFSMLYRDVAVRDAARDAVRARFPEVEAVSSLGDNLEFNAPGVSKGRGLAELARTLGLVPAQVMTCGDGGNDLTMVRYAGLGVAMGNAEPAVKAAAQYIAPDNNHDGVADAVEKFVLGAAQGL